MLQRPTDGIVSLVQMSDVYKLIARVLLSLSLPEEPQEHLHHQGSSPTTPPCPSSRSTSQYRHSCGPQPA